MAAETDLLILGGGTGGYVAAIRAAQKGQNVVIVEKSKLGGTCLHRGCIPTKALLRSAEVYETVKSADEFGISSVEAGFDFLKVQARKEKVVEQLHQGVQALCQKNKIKIYNGEGAILGPSIFSPVSGAVAITFPDSDKEDLIIVPKKLIIATGSSPRSLPNVAIDERYILSSNGMLELETLPEKMAIIGGGVIGVEWASLLNSFGVDVTIIEYADRLVINESESVSRELKKQFKKRGIHIMTQAAVESAEVIADKVSVRVKEQQEMQFDKVMVAVGRTPNVNGIGLQNTSVQFDDKGIHVNEYYQTTESHIYAIGDCINTLQLAHVASKEGEIAVNHLCGETVEPLNYNDVPKCTYTHPEIASVGYHSSNFPENMNVKVGKFYFKGNGKSLIHGDADGFVEVLRDEETDDLVGVTIIGPNATDLIGEASTAIYLNASALELGEAVHAHPTISESVMEAALDAYGLAIHK
ncbi:dihydrolipoyl dehydrogenase [Macrococcus hajekii]|uniref:Dihydrolipoyl dehydrogenase n=1 Tax=Macrococcus hajekii TaxID=198482 RepID=A0A4V6PPN9_9STAP|nr:dihydrolipoyl dehydrogenase [Macrococcus hajekii]TDM01964.1 dihydrolipoyl dehydrogenase [Macrococcus hajekii]GGB08886.1 dihydrolipoyl dehydrogenase [Macrococcus hajekii]